MQREKWSFLFTQIPLCLKAINRKLYVLPYTVNFDWKENVIAIESQKFSTLQKYPCEIIVHSRPVVFSSYVYIKKNGYSKKKSTLYYYNHISSLKSVLPKSSAVFYSDWLTGERCDFYLAAWPWGKLA